MTTVYDTLTDARGLALINRPVTLRLRTGGRVGGFHAETTSHIVQATVVRTDAAGRWEANLAPLDSIEPAGSYYTADAVDVDTVAFVVPPPPAAGGALWVRDLVVEAPESNGSVIAGVMPDVLDDKLNAERARQEARYARVIDGAIYGPNGVVTGPSAPDPHLVDVAGDAGTDDDAAVELVAVRPDTGATIGVVGRATLRGGWLSKITHLPDSVGPSAHTFADVLDAGTGHQLAFTVGEGDEVAGSYDSDRVWRFHSQWPIVLWSDSMLGKLTEPLRRELSAALGWWPIVQQAISGDMPQSLAARMGAIPPGVKVLDGRNDTLGLGVIPASGSCRIRLSTQLQAANPQGFPDVEVAGVRGMFYADETAAIVDPSDPGAIPFVYTDGTFVRRAPGVLVAVPDGTPLHIGGRYRDCGAIFTPSRHAFARRYVLVSIPTTTAPGSTFTATLVNGQTTGPITVAATDADTRQNIATAVNALSGAVGASVFVGDTVGGNITPARVFTVQFADSDTAGGPVTVTGSGVTVGPYRLGLDDSTTALRAMLAHQTDESRRRLIVTDTGPFSSEVLGSSRRAKFDTYLAAVRDLAGPYYLPAFAMLRHRPTLESLGVTLTAGDDADIAQGLTPRTLRVQDNGTTDAGHLGAVGYRCLIALVAQAARARGIIR